MCHDFQRKACNFSDKQLSFEDGLSSAFKTHMIRITNQSLPLAFNLWDRTYKKERNTEVYFLLVESMHVTLMFLVSAWLVLVSLCSRIFFFQQHRAIKTPEQRICDPCKSFLFTYLQNYHTNY